MNQQPNRMVQQAPQCLVGRFYLTRTGHCHTGQYLKRTTKTDRAERRRRHYKTQTREHLFKHCKEWKPQQKALWAEVRKETGGGKNRFTIRDLFVEWLWPYECVGGLDTSHLLGRVVVRGDLLELLLARCLDLALEP